MEGAAGSPADSSADSASELDRARSLAARVDAMLASEDDEPEVDAEVAPGVSQTKLDVRAAEPGAGDDPADDDADGASMSIEVAHEDLGEEPDEAPAEAASDEAASEAASDEAASEAASDEAPASLTKLDVRAAEAEARDAGKEETEEKEAERGEGKEEGRAGGEGEVGDEGEEELEAVAVEMEDVMEEDEPPPPRTITVPVSVPPPPRIPASLRPPGQPPMPPALPPRPVVVVPPRPPVPPGAGPGMGGLGRVPPVLPRPPAPRAAGPAPLAPVPPPVAIPPPVISVPPVPMPVPPTPAPAKGDDPAAAQGGAPAVAEAAAPATDGAARRSASHLQPPGAPPLIGSADSASFALGPSELSDGGIEVNTQTPKIVEDRPLEAHLESPTVVERALAELGDAGGERRADAMLKELDATVDSVAAAMLAYELGELYERRLADEARAVKAYGRALTLDPSLRANLWAIRRVFYRRGLWPNLVKLIAAEVAYARDDEERADLLLEKARVAQRTEDGDDGREALEEAVRIAPHHQGALLELERVLARAGDAAALLDVWEWLAEAAEHPQRKVSYWLEVGRAAASREYGRAQEAFERAAQLAAGTPAAERVARERLRAAEEHGTPDDIAAAIDALAAHLLAAFGPAGPAEGADVEAPARATQLRREIVALRRRQAQLGRGDAPEKAWDVLQQALALAPGEPLVLADLTELAEELGRYDDLAELVQSWQAVEGDPGRAMVLSIRRADALLRGGQRDQARALLAGLEASAPGFIVLTSAAERDALGRCHAGDLARTYLAAAHAALLGSWLGPGQPPAPDPHAAAALYVQAAELLAYEVAPGELPPEAPLPLDEAHAALGKALEAVPGYLPALEALTELDDTTGNVAEGLERLRAAADAADGDARRAILERAIRLARGHGDLDSVLELERAIIRLAPEELALKWRLESTLSQLGHDEERAELLSEIAATEVDATRRGTALLAAARLRERAGAVEAATDLYRQVLLLWPDDTFARESLIDLLRAQERWAELVSERRAEARALPDGPAARRALREASWVLEVRAADTASAAQVYDEWLQRFGDDRTALEGAARCRAQFGDRLGEVAARRAIADLDPSAESQWLFARALERAAQFDDAADAYRLLMVRDEASVAATAAAFGLADLAAARGDTVMRVEATAALASRTTEPRLGAALAEDSGWMYALALEDNDRAAQSFAAAIALDPTRRGALLGAALVAAKQNDPGALAAAYEGLAASVAMPEAAAALHLRAAAVAAATGDVELANARVAAARGAAPDDTSALLVVAETAPPPQIEADDPDAAIDPLLARAEVLEMRSALADDPAARATWELDRAEALELAGRLREAGAVVVAVLRADPGDLRALEAMRRMGKRAGDDLVWAQASYQLARVLGDPAAKLSLLRDAASVIDAPEARATPEAGAPPGGSGRRADLALAIYRRILQVDPGAPELDRLLELLRQRADVRGLIGALGERLTWLEAEAQDLARDQQMVPLLLERATVLHGLGDQGAAMADLDALLDRAASHAEALRFRADLAFDAGDVDGAVALWRRCLAAETRPHRRGEIELQLAKVLAENVNDVAGAIENLERVAEANPDDIELRERLLALCLRANDWDRAVRELKVLARLRPTPQDKAREELRLGIMFRDRLNDRTSARLALDRARTLDPLNLDVVRELAELLEPPARAQVLAGTAASFRASIVQNPRSALLYDRLAQVAAWQSDVDARWLALVGLEALGTPSVDQRQVLEQGRQQLGTPARVKLDPAARAILRGPASGPLVELWRAIAPAAQVSTGVDPGKLGFGRGDRIALKKLGGTYEALAIALTCFGIDELDVYVSGGRMGVAWGLAAETPILCLGADIAGARTPAQRWALGRAVAMIADGFTTLPDLREAELGWTIMAALRAAEAAVPPALAEEVDVDNAAIAERTRVIKKELNRKARGTVQQLAQQRAAELIDVAGFRRQALAAASRAGLLWSGDLAVALAQLDVGRGGKALTDSAAALELTAWSVSEEHRRLRELLGIALKGAR
jgi:hypothetical protein